MGYGVGEKVIIEIFENHKLTKINNKLVTVLVAFSLDLGLVKKYITTGTYCAFGAKGILRLRR